MKLVLSTIAAVSIATTAFAGNSDRYNDLRLNTAVGHVTSHDTAKPSVKRIKTQAPQRVRISTRNANTSKPYAYQNPHGVGPDNDSR